MDHYYNVWVVAAKCQVDTMYKMQKHMSKINSVILAASLEPLFDCLNAPSLRLFYWCYFGKESSELAELISMPYPCQNFLF